MKKRIYSILFSIAISTALNAQDEIDRHLTVGISGGIDYNINAYKTAINPTALVTDYYGINPHYNIGINVGIMFTPKIRLRAESKYLTMSYGQNWISSSIFDKTITSLTYLDFNLYFDYLVLKKGNFEFYVSPGFKSEFILNHKFETYDANDKNAKFSGLEKIYPNTLAGGSISSIIKYNITKRLGITLTPDYTIFFRNFNLNNSELYQRFSANMGIEFKF